MNIFNQDWFVGLISAVALAVGAGLSTLIGLWFKKLADNLAEKTKNEKYSEILLLVKNLIQDAIMTVQQTFTEQLKKDGKFDEEKQKEAFKLAMNIIKGNLTTEAEKVLDELYGDAQRWIEIQIESMLASLKRLGK